MAWNAIRKATEEDYEKLDQRAKAFYVRHDLQCVYPMPSESVTAQEMWVIVEDIAEQWYTRRLLCLWRRIVQRALKHKAAEGIAYGYVGYAEKNSM